MFKLLNLTNWLTGLVESITFYGGGGKGGSSKSVSTPVDFFGVGKRAPYADLLSQLLLGDGKIGATSGSGGRATNLPPGVIDAGGGKYHRITTSNINPVTGWPSTEGRSYTGGPSILTPWIPPKGWSPTTTPATGGMSIADYIKSTPGYQFGMDQGQQALERSYSSRGFGQSGNESIALSGYGQQYAGQQYQQLISNLMAPSGTGLIGNQTVSSSQGPSGLGGILGTVAGIGLSMGNPFGSAQSMGAMMSDRNLKTNIKYIDTINGIKIYSFNYIWSYIKSIGVMAQDLLKMPQYKDAVHMTSIGYAVDYSKLPI